MTTTGGRTTSIVGPSPKSTSEKPTAAEAGPRVGSATTTPSMVIVTVEGPDVEIQADPLAVGRQRLLVQGDVLGRPTVDADRDRAEVADRSRALRLVQRDVVDGLGHLEPDALALGGGPVGDQPGGALVVLPAVDGHEGSIFGPVGEGLTVGGGGGGDRPLLDGDRLGRRLPSRS